jgi:hypothetical protein
MIKLADLAVKSQGSYSECAQIVAWKGHRLSRIMRSVIFQSLSWDVPG